MAEDDGKPTGDGTTPTVEELLAQLKERDDKLKKQAEDFAGLNTRLTEVTDSNARMEQLLKAATQRVEPDATKGEQIKLSRDFATEFNISNDLALALVTEGAKIGAERAKSDMREEWRMAEALRETAQSFYVSNPDLKDHKPIVQAISNDIRAKEPTLTLDQALKKTAEKAREYIKSIQGKGAGGEEPPPVLPGSQTGGGSLKPVPEKVLSPDEELADDIKARKAQTQKAVGR